ncbi:CBS domain-containing protein [Aestuariibaculum sp. YM273]|uniref:CBS domain-containing protein n=1 Tax=Aestuariibaculum sp. YM273 TaxID=3070659 RepID=UPI0027DB3D47|nr:CBS domain-containing protein [Aestuariibaculum sp. YM273]WMI66683.1 CBS domain-containing protein [Aestuariibaculum sp. YM273]
MGDLNVTQIKTKKDQSNYIHHLLNDIKALDIMIEEGMIEAQPQRIGAEQEVFLVNDQFLPENKSLEFLKKINHKNFTTEISTYTFEINLDVFELKDSCFSALHKQLDHLLEQAKKVAATQHIKLVLTGILPSLSINNVGDKSMTDTKRYSVLNEIVKKTRKRGFNVHIKGVDELNLLHNSAMLEGCNNSFQSHLQIKPKTFVDDYNWAQAIAGPILSICTNSPLLFGKELWSETRIALFTQSFDMRVNSYLLNEKQSRVSFGNQWQTGSITDIYKDNISRFRGFLTTNFTKTSVELLKEDKIPRLRALHLHNGTVYPWNRVCYGITNGKPNLRIENRYIPSGPTTTDEIANMVFWVGVMLGKPEKYSNIHEKWDFKDVKTNFFNAARYGMATQFYWDGKYVSSFDLILNELLPMAYKGLQNAGISADDSEYYLRIIKSRVHSRNASEWLVRNYRHLLKSHKRFEAMQILTAKMYEKQEEGIPVHHWEMLTPSYDTTYKHHWIVKHVMSSDIFSVNKNDTIELVIQVMTWKNIHHMPVIDTNEELIGLVSWKDLECYLNDVEKQKNSISDIMKTDIKTIEEYASVSEAKNIMKEYNISCLPVVKYKKLVGLLTLKDF